MSGNRRQNRQQTARQPQGADVKYPRGAGVYPRELVPVARPGDYVRLEPNEGMHRVDLIEPQPGIDAFDSDQSNGVTASSNSTTSDKDATELEQRDGWVGQMRMVRPDVDIPDGIEEVQVDQGGGQSPLWTSVEARGYMNSADSAALAGYTGVHEFYVWGDNAPKFTFVNNQNSDITVNDVQFAGYHIKLTSNVRKPQGVQEVVLPVQAVSSVG